MDIVSYSLFDAICFTNLSFLLFLASGNNTGSAFLYSRTGPGNTFQLNVIFPSPAAESHFGQSLDVNDYYAAIGAYAFSKSFSHFDSNNILSHILFLL